MVFLLEIWLLLWKPWNLFCKVFDCLIMERNILRVILRIPHYWMLHQKNFFFKDMVAIVFKLAQKRLIYSKIIKQSNNIFN